MLSTELTSRIGLPCYVLRIKGKKVELIKATMLALDGESGQRDKTYGNLPNYINLDIGILSPYWASVYDSFRNDAKNPYCIPYIYAKELKGKKFKYLKVGLFFSPNDAIKYLEYSQKMETQSLENFERRSKRVIERAQKRILSLAKKRADIEKRGELIQQLKDEEKQIEEL